MEYAQMPRVKSAEKSEGRGIKRKGEEAERDRVEMGRKLVHELTLPSPSFEIPSVGSVDGPNKERDDTGVIKIPRRSN